MPGGKGSKRSARSGASIAPSNSVSPTKASQLRAAASESRKQESTTSTRKTRAKIEAGDLTVKSGGKSATGLPKGIHIHKLQMDDLGELKALGFKLAIALEAELEKAIVFDQPIDPKDTKIVYLNIPCRSELYYITTQGQTVKDRRVRELTIPSKRVGKGLIMCMATGKPQHKTHMIAEHAEEYHFIKHSQAVLLAFLNENIAFAKLFVSCKTMGNYFKVVNHPDTGKEIVVGTRAFYLKGFNRGDNLWSICQAANLQKSHFLKGVNDYGHESDTFKAKIIAWFKTLPLFTEEFTDSLDACMQKGFLFNMVCEPSEGEVDDADMLELVDGHPISLVMPKEAIGLGQFAHAWFVERHMPFMKMTKKALKLEARIHSESVKVATGVDTEGRRMPEAARIRREVIHKALVSGADAMVGRPSIKLESSSSEDEQELDPSQKWLLEVLTGIARHDGKIARDHVEHVWPALESISNYKLENVKEFLSQNLSLMGMLPNEVWGAIEGKITGAIDEISDVHVVETEIITDFKTALSKFGSEQGRPAHSREQGWIISAIEQSDPNSAAAEAPEDDARSSSSANIASKPNS